MFSCSTEKWVRYQCYLFSLQQSCKVSAFRLTQTIKGMYTVYYITVCTSLLTRIWSLLAALSNDFLFKILRCLPQNVVFFLIFKDSVLVFIKTGPLGKSFDHLSLVLYSFKLPCTPSQNIPLPLIKNASPRNHLRYRLSQAMTRSKSIYIKILTKLLCVRTFVYLLFYCTFEVAIFIYLSSALVS